MISNLRRAPRKRLERVGDGCEIRAQLEGERDDGERVARIVRAGDVQLDLAEGLTITQHGEARLEIRGAEIFQAVERRGVMPVAHAARMRAAHAHGTGVVRAINHAVARL